MLAPQACVARGGSDVELSQQTQILTEAIADYKRASKTVKGLESQSKPKAAKSKAKPAAKPPQSWSKWSSSTFGGQLCLVHSSEGVLRLCAIWGSSCPHVLNTSPASSKEATICFHFWNLDAWGRMHEWCIAMRACWVLSRMVEHPHQSLRPGPWGPGEPLEKTRLATSPNIVYTYIYTYIYSSCHCFVVWFLVAGPDYRALPPIRMEREKIRGHGWLMFGPNISQNTISPKRTVFNSIRILYPVALPSQMCLWRSISSQRLDEVHLGCMQLMGRQVEGTPWFWILKLFTPFILYK